MSASGPATLAGRRLYLCTPDRPDLESFLHDCLSGGVDMVQLRDKELDTRTSILRATVAAGCCAEHAVPFVVNDRPDVALACGADGVHVGQDDIPPAVARRILGPGALIGLSTHSPSELAASRDEPVDYVSAGPVEPTPTKPGRPGTGSSYAGHADRHAGRPVFVTGGVRPETVGALVAAGARRFVVVRYLTEADDPEAAARRLRSAIDDAVDAAGPHHDSRRPTAQAMGGAATAAGEDSGSLALQPTDEQGHGSRVSPKPMPGARQDA